MPKLLKEPLLHFLAGALCIFAYFWAIGDNRDPQNYTIEISSSDIDRIAADAIRTSSRLPTHDEISALVDQNIQEEIFYREALRLGLDDGDAVIRRRLANKMRSLNTSEIGDPSDDDLQKWMDKNPDRYIANFQYAFKQIYIGRTIGIETQKKWLEQLRNKSINANDIREGLSITLDQSLSNTNAIKRKFGTNFTNALQNLKKDQWEGPIESGFGMHFIYIHDKKADSKLQLKDIRQRVNNDWYNAQIMQTQKSAYRELAQQYDIIIAEFK